MSDSEINIFVSIAPSHNRSFESLLKTESLKGKKILINIGNYEYSPRMWDAVIEDYSPMRNPSSENLLATILFQLKKILAYKRIISSCKKKIPSKGYTLFYCNLEDILNNFMFFRFRKNLQEERILVEDGILNYYEYKIESPRKPNFILKKILCWFLRVPYKVVEGQLSGIDRDDVQKQFVRYPSLALFPEKALRLESDIIDFEPSEDSILFIGQDVLANIVAKQDYLDGINQIIEKIQENCSTASKVHYKPHRNGDYKIAEELLIKAFGNQYELVIDERPVETILSNIRPMYIYSFFSSALFNIKLGAKDVDKLKVFSLPINQVDNLVLNLFRKVDIIVMK
ncbi:MAG: polysialyltransferase family glycosyltransferase [Bacteroidota bacterium]